MITFWFTPATSFSSYSWAITNFGKRKNKIWFLESSQLSTSVFLALSNARMKQAIQLWLLKCVCNTFGNHLAFQLLVESWYGFYATKRRLTTKLPFRKWLLFSTKIPFLAMQQCYYAIIFRKISHRGIHIHRVPKQLFIKYSLKFCPISKKNEDFEKS